MANSFDLDKITERVVKQAGLDDFGPPGWRDPLVRLLQSATEEAHLNETGQAILHMQIADRLTNRLQIQKWVMDHPKVHDLRVEAPLVLATLPRTGQTAAGWILDRDPANRSLLRWFVKRPVPPPRPEDIRSDPRIALEQDHVGYLPQAVLDMHLSDAEEPDECHWLLSNDMKVPHEDMLKV